MDKIERSIRSFLASVATVALLAAPANLAAQDATEQEEQKQEQQEQSTPETRTAPAPRALPHVTGTVVRWNGYRIDLKTTEGKTQEVAVNEDTERLIEIEPGAEVMIEYRRKIGDFIIAERVRSPKEAGTAAKSGTNTAPAASPSMVTGTVVSRTDAALVLRTNAGDVTLFLSPRTEYLVKSLEPGLMVTVEYQATSKDAKLATRIQAAEKGAGQEPKSGG
jgi:Ni/Co efflux regulator RcnB